MNRRERREMERQQKREARSNNDYEIVEQKKIGKYHYACIDGEIVNVDYTFASIFFNLPEECTEKNMGKTWDMEYIDGDSNNRHIENIRLVSLEG